MTKVERKGRTGDELDLMQKIRHLDKLGDELPGDGRWRRVLLA